MAVHGNHAVSRHTEGGGIPAGIEFLGLGPEHPVASGEGLQVGVLVHLHLVARHVAVVANGGNLRLRGTTDGGHLDVKGSAVCPGAGKEGVAIGSSGVGVLNQLLQQLVHLDGHILHVLWGVGAVGTGDGQLTDAVHDFQRLVHVAFGEG